MLTEVEADVAGAQHVEVGVAAAGLLAPHHRAVREAANGAARLKPVGRAGVPNRQTVCSMCGSLVSIVLWVAIRSFKHTGNHTHEIACPQVLRHIANPDFILCFFSFTYRPTCRA